MAKDKSGKKKNPGRPADSKKRDNGSAEIKRAEKRLAAALAGVDEAREKVQRRERDLAQLIDRHGRTAPSSTIADDAISLETPSQPASENGAPHFDVEAVEAEPVKQADAAEGDGHHT